MDDAAQKFIESLKQSNNILVTVKSDPSLDQLSACIALTLMLNGLGKHATAVFSGAVPSVLEFLEPEKTIQTNTDSLQDFIISLDKAKADKLRYKVEDTVVKIFITPYRTSLTEKDLEFGQGDFNVDVVVALGVHAQADVDAAITAHGRILHDATVISINTQPGVADDLGSINWVNPDVSSLSEMITNVSDELLGDKKDELFDNQVATALLTGIVAETERFGNSRTKPETMQTAARLLQAGANQELVAAKLSESQHDHEADTGSHGQPEEEGRSGNSPAAPADVPAAGAGEGDGNADGSLDIDHRGDDDHDHDDHGDGNHEAAADDSTTHDAPADNPLIHDVHHSAAPESSDEVDQLAAASATADSPHTYDLNQISVPASASISPQADAPVAPALPPQTEVAPDGQHVPVPDPAAEERALQEMLSRYSPPKPAGEAPPPQHIQPLRDQNGFMAEPPLHDKKADPAGDKGQPVDSTLDATKFAVTPPMMGGQLTAAHEAASLEPSTDPLSASSQLVTPRPIMTHDPHSLTTPPQDAVQPDLPSPSSPSAASLPPSPASHSHAGETLAELEQELGSPHAAQPLDSPLTMPLPTIPPVTTAPAAGHEAAQGQVPPVTPPPPAPPPLPAALGSQIARS